VRREAFQGVRQIVMFNWPLYALAVAALACTSFAIPRVPDGWLGRQALFASAGLASFWLAASLAVSWFVYDRSPLMTARWIPGALGIQPQTWLNLHAGLDEWTPALRALLPESHGRTLDIFDQRVMSESSISRARRDAQRRSEHADFRHLPAASGTIDAVFLFFCAHELRTHAARCELFGEVSRVLASGGRIIVVEQLREWRNFLAFGPGFLHFHSGGAWRRCFAHARLLMVAESSVTPFVRVFVLEKQP
jgi:SAM-dependent methyltransferase